MFGLISVIAFLLKAVSKYRPGCASSTECLVELLLKANYDSFYNLRTQRIGAHRSREAIRHRRRRLLHHTCQAQVWTVNHNTLTLVTDTPRKSILLWNKHLS